VVVVGSSSSSSSTEGYVTVIDMMQLLLPRLPQDPVSLLLHVSQNDYTFCLSRLVGARERDG